MIPDCRSCGACCVGPLDQESYADLDEADLKRLGPRRRHLLVFQPSPFQTFVQALGGPSIRSASMRTSWRSAKTGKWAGHQFCACVALRGSVGHQVSCSIYDVRPAVCRDAVKPGDRVCLEIRRRMQEQLDG